VSEAILAGLGGAVARTVLDDSYTAYVRPVMRLPLALAALVMLTAGVAGGLRTASRHRQVQRRRASPSHGHVGRIPAGTSRWSPERTRFAAC
jgi:hypothetical protein